MNEKLLEIQPRELKFVFELKKQSSCTAQIVNNTDHYVAFKVKTTTLNKYYVNPNMSIVKPKSTCDIIFIMEAQKLAPANLKCKDKFLIQSTSVPFGTTEEEISHSLFNKDNGRYIDESKLRVVLLSAHPFPVSQIVTLKQMPPCEAPVSTDLVEGLFTPLVVTEDLKLLTPIDRRLAQDSEDMKVADSNECKVTTDVKELKLKMKKMEFKLSEIEFGITRLRKDWSINMKQTLKQEQVMSETDDGQEAQVGFSFLFVCLMFLIGLEFGYRLSS